MVKQNYFDKKLVGGAINQKGIKYQIYICIKYIFDFLDDDYFKGISIEQYDDFTINKEKEEILCQVKSTCYNMNKVKKFLKRNCDRKRILICSAFTDDVNNLIYKREWYEKKENNALNDEEKILIDYKNEIEKYHLDYEIFNNTKLVAISYKYSEEISKNAIIHWAQKNNMAINTDKLFETLYHEISKLGSQRGSLLKDRIYEIIRQCIEVENAINTALDIMEPEGVFDENNTIPETQIYYAKDGKNNIFSPKLGYWDHILLNDEPMYPLQFDVEPFHCDLPNFDIKVLNNSKHALFLTEIVTEVISSIPDPSPIIYINGSEIDNNPRHIELNNAGWGEIKNLKMQINCDTKCNENFSEFEAEEYIGDFETKKDIDLTGMLHQATKIDFEKFEYEYEKLLNNGEHDCEKLLIKYFGKYASGDAYVNGILDFYSDTAEERNKHFILKFSSWINLYIVQWGGAFFSPTYQYDIELPVKGSNYVAQKTISQKLEPGEADRFNLKIHCAQSSKHRLNIYLKDISGKKIEVKKNVHLNICIPRSRKN